MKTFRFTVTRDITESVKVEVDAPDIHTAHRLALDGIEKYADTDHLGNVDWEVDDAPTGGIYVPDPDDYLEYKD